MPKYSRSDLIKNLEMQVSMIPDVNFLGQTDDGNKVLEMDIGGIDMALGVMEHQEGITVFGFVPGIEVPDDKKSEIREYLMELNNKTVRGYFTVMDSSIIYKHFITLTDGEKMRMDHFIYELTLPSKMMKYNLEEICDILESSNPKKEDKDHNLCKLRGYM